MDDALFEEVLQEALEIPEVARTLQSLASGNPERLTALHNELAGHVREHREAMERLASDAAERYADAQAAFLTAKGKDPASFMMDSPELVQLREAAESAKSAVEESASRLTALISERTGRSETPNATSYGGRFLADGGDRRRGRRAEEPAAAAPVAVEEAQGRRSGRH